jgi:hypothetical protein
MTHFYQWNYIEIFQECPMLLFLYLLAHDSH